MAISWMQKHKKWLVVTIWISTIAFVGAGFVGWGSYEMGKSGGTIGSVGDKEIEVRDVQNEYSKLYNQYQQMFGASFNNEMAEKLNLQSQAYNNVIQKYLLLNLADEIGIEATDKEIAASLVKYEPFLKDGKFDKEQYIKALKMNRSNPSEFEEDLKKNINIDKLTTILSHEVQENTMTKISNLFFAEDKIAIKIISSSKLRIMPKANDIKAYYEKNKENYKSIKQYKLLTKTFPINKENEKASKKDALKAYLQAKKNELTLEDTLLVDSSTIQFAQEDLEKIFKAKKGDFIKPLKTADSYVVAQLVEILEPSVQAYEEVQSQVKTDYMAELTQTMLNKEKEKVINNFDGKEVGFVSKNMQEPIAGLTKDETATFLNELFNSKTQMGDVTLGDKVVVFKILESRLGTETTNNEYLKQNINQIINNEILVSLIKKLELKYQIDSQM
jgi:peptidyl-prolyl cis-trans isomerase D